MSGRCVLVLRPSLSYGSRRRRVTRPRWTSHTSDFHGAGVGRCYWFWASRDCCGFGSSKRQDMRTLFEGLEEAFRFLDGVPKEILFDQMRSVIVEDRRWESGPLVENPEFVRFAHHWQ